MNRCLIPLLLCALCLTASPLHAQQMLERTYNPSDAELVNPERGFYRQWNAQDGQGALDLDTMKQHRADGMPLMLRLYYYKTYRDRPLDQQQLDLFDRDMNTLRQAGLKAILRFAYTEAIGDPDAPIDVVLGHMQQLKPLIRKHADVIAIAQGGFVGAWGEWHASSNDLAEPPNARRIVAQWLDNLPESRVVQIRTPRLKWMLVGHNAPLTRDHAWTTPAGRIAHHNDCFVSSPTDVGTYENIEVEKAYLDQETRFLPMGGETCMLNALSSPDNAEAELRRFHWSYLNLSYNPQVIDLWRKEGFLQDVRDHLGYRLHLEKAATSPDASAGGSARIELTLNNTGYAAPFNPREVRIALRNTRTDETYEASLPVETRAWLPDQPIALSATLGLPDSLPEGNYRWHLMIADGSTSLRDRPDYAIQLANDRLYNKATGWHDLGINLKVSGTAHAGLLADVHVSRSSARPAR